MAETKNIKQLYLERKFLYNIIFLCVLYFCHCFWGNMMYVAFPILAVMIILDNLENGFSYIVFSIPFCFLNVYISTIFMLVCGLVYIVKFHIVCYVKEKTKPNLWVLIPVAIFLIYCLLPIGNYNLNTLIRFFLFSSLFIALSMILRKPEIFRGHFNVKLMCCSILVASLFSMTYFFSPYLKEYLIIFYANDGTLARFMALFYNTNVLAMFCEVLLSLLAYFIIRKQSTKADWFLFAAIACVGFLTFSKTYIIILLLICIVLLVWMLCCNFKKTFVIALAIGAILAAVCTIAYFVYPQVYHKIAEVFIRSFGECKNARDFMNIITTDRFNLWIEYSHYIAANPLVLFFGRGLGAPVLSTISTHNAYISCVYELGLVGISLFGIALFFMLKEGLKNRNTKIHWAIFLPILVIGLICMVEDLIFYIFE